MIDVANKLGYLLLTQSIGGKILISPQDIESISDYSETSGKKTKTFRSVSSNLNEKGWLVIETLEEILQQIENMPKDET